MEVYSINNTRVRNLDQAVSLIREDSQDVVTILAIDENSRIKVLTEDPRLALVGTESTRSTDVDDDEYRQILQGRVSVKEASTVKDARQILQPRPPAGRLPGGVWGTHAYAGRTTMESAALVELVFGGGVCSLSQMLCFPEDLD